MSDRHELRAYDYVVRPYATVVAVLRADPAGVLGRATKGAGHRAGDVAASLRASIGTLEVGTDVTIEVGAIEEAPSGPHGRSPVLRIPLRWRAAHASALFPSMEAVLSAWAISKDETQLELRGVYRPPLGVLGDAVDAIALGRLADASVHRFVADVAGYITSR